MGQDLIRARCVNMLPNGGSYKYAECMAYITLIVFRMISFHKRKISIQKDSKDIAHQNWYILYY